MRLFRFRNKPALLRDNASMSNASPSDWNAFARANAAQRWRQQSAQMGQHMTDAIVEAAAVRPGRDVLDVACGTGEPAISIARMMNGTGSVVGVDISAEPLKIAEQRAGSAGSTNVRFQQGDVHQLAFADGSFDRVTCRLGLMFFADCPRALREIHRVLRPGGRAALLAWGPMQQPYFETTIGTILRTVPELKLPASGAAMFKFGEQGKLTAMLHEAGFSEVNEEFRTVSWSWPGPPEDVWAYFKDVTVPFKPLFEAVPPERRGEADAAVLEAMRHYYDGQQVNFTATIALATAEK